MMIPLKLGQWLDYTLGTEPRQRLRLSRTLLATCIYSGCIAVQFGSVHFGIADTNWAIALTSFLILGQISFYAAIRSGRFLKSSDPALTVPQMLFAFVAITLAYLINPAIRAMIAMIMALVLLFGAFILPPKRCRHIGRFAVVLLASAMLAASLIQPQIFDPLIEMFNICISSLILTAVARLAGQLSEIRVNQQKQKKQLTLTIAESALRSAALVEAKDKLRIQAEQSNQEKSRFLARAVHDLRQPLQAIGNALYPALTAHHNLDRQTTHNMLTLAQKATDMMRNQLSKILDVSRLESGQIKADMRPFELTTVVQEALSQLAGTALERGVDVVWDATETGPIFICSDADFIQRTLVNLIDNGIKYADKTKPSRPCVRVVLVVGDQEVCIQVIDNGIGIAQEHIDSGQIFEPFFQVVPPLPGNEKGVGLGLSIVKAMDRLMPAHTLRLQSTLHQGSTFSLRVPKSQEATPLPPSSTDEAAAPMPSLAGFYLIFVEDDPLILRSSHALFESLGILFEAYDSYEALDEGLHTLERTPDLLLTDYDLPNQRTATDVIQRVRSEFADTAVIVFSGDTDALARLKPLTDITFLHKPLAPQALIAAIHQVTAR